MPLPPQIRHKYLRFASYTTQFGEKIFLRLLPPPIRRESCVEKKRMAGVWKREREVRERRREFESLVFHISTGILRNSRSRFYFPSKERDLQESTVTKCRSNPLVSLRSWHSACWCKSKLMSIYCNSTSSYELRNRSERRCLLLRYWWK